MIQIDISLLSVLIPLNKKHITFPQLVVLHSYYVITTVYPILTSPGYEIKYVRVFIRMRSEKKNFHRIVFGLKKKKETKGLLYISLTIRGKSCVENGEGLDRAGGFAVQVHFQFLVFICNDMYRVWEAYSSKKLKEIFIVL